MRIHVKNRLPLTAYRHDLGHNGYVNAAIAVGGRGGHYLIELMRRVLDTLQKSVPERYRKILSHLVKA